MNQVTQITGAELDIAVAIALGASKEKRANENVIACGMPLQYRAPMFALVNAAGISIRWQPTTDWNQGGPLLANLIDDGYVLLHAPTEPVGLLKGGELIEGANVLEATCRAIVAMFGKVPA
jgi:hypothetical protein